MASCHVVRRQLEAGEFDPDALPPSATAHLAQCAACRTFAAQMQNLRLLLAEQPRIVPPANFDAQIRLRLGREAHRFREAWLAWVPTPVLASLAAAVVVVSALAVRSSVQLALESPAPTITEALTKPTLPEQTLATTLSTQLGAAATTRPALLPRPTAVPTRVGRTPVLAVSRSTTAPVNENSGVVVLWRGRSGERVMRLPKVIYGVQPIVERRAGVGNESSDDSVF